MNSAQYSFASHVQSLGVVGVCCFLASVSCCEHCTGVCCFLASVSCCEHCTEVCCPAALCHTTHVQMGCVAEHSSSQTAEAHSESQGTLQSIVIL